MSLLLERKTEALLGECIIIHDVHQLELAMALQAWINPCATMYAMCLPKSVSPYKYPLFIQLLLIYLLIKAVINTYKLECVKFTILSRPTCRHTYAMFTQLSRPTCRHIYSVFTILSRSTCRHIYTLCLPSWVGPHAGIYILCVYHPE